MRHAAKIKRIAALVVAATVFIGGDIQTRKVMAEETTTPQQPAEQSQPARPAQVWGEEKAGVACSISTKKTTFQPGEPIPVRFDVKNVSDKPQTIWHCGFWPNHRWVVRDAAGRDLKLTDRGRLCRDRYDDPRREKNFPVVVQPGKLDAAYYGPYDLRRYFEIPDDVTLHVRCVYKKIEDGKSVEITSNKLSLTIGRSIAVENDGVQGEAIVPDRSWEIPEQVEGKHTKVDLALRITNRTGRAFYFSRYDTIWPTLKSTSGKSYKLTETRLRTRQPTTADYPLLKSGDSVTFPLDAHLYWQDDELRLGGSDGFGGIWFFHGLEPGENELVLAYYMRTSRLSSDVRVRGEGGANVMIPKDEVWVGEVQATPVTITLAEPSERHKTTAFLGPEDQWPGCRIVLEDIQPLWGGTAIYLGGSGPCVIRMVDRGKEKRFRIKLSPTETRVLRKLCIDADLLTVAIKDRPGVPDEARPTIMLRNAKGETFTLTKWANDEVPRFDKVYQVLRELRKKTEGSKPEYDGKWQREWRLPESL